MCGLKKALTKTEQHETARIPTHSPSDPFLSSFSIRCGASLLFINLIEPQSHQNKKMKLIDHLFVQLKLKKQYKIARMEQSSIHSLT